MRGIFCCYYNLARKSKKSHNKMFTEILDDVQVFISPHLRANGKFNNELSNEEWQQISKLCLARFKEGWEFLVASAKSILSDRLFNHSKPDFLYPGQPMNLICEIRIRPSNTYYRYQNMSIPRPENQRGFDATGIELTISLYSPYIVNKIPVPLRVGLLFQVWGNMERLAFYSLYQNYKRVLELIFRRAKPIFETACVFEKLDSYKGNDPIKKLDLYFLSNDKENNFSLNYWFTKNQSDEDFLQAFLVLSVIYDSCYYYSSKRKQYDKILEHYYKLMLS